MYVSCVSLSVREGREVDWARESRLLAPEHELDALNLARSELLLVEHRAESTRSIQKSLHKRLVCPSLLAHVSFPVSRREEHYSALKMACWPTAPFFGVLGGCSKGLRLRPRIGCAPPLRPQPLGAGGTALIPFLLQEWHERHTSALKGLGLTTGGWSGGVAHIQFFAA